jgi:hypothetical protein
MKYANHFNYIQKVRSILIQAGTQGINQHELNQRTRTKVFQRDDLMAILLEWKGRGWVQSFRVKGISRHPRTVWRATNKLRDDWAMFNTEYKDEGEVRFPRMPPLHEL